jgi:hypothetical protein
MQSQQALPGAGLLSNLSKECHSLDQVVSSVLYHHNIQSEALAHPALRQNAILLGSQFRAEIVCGENHDYCIDVIRRRRWQ